jgi:hypothetical protein
MMRPSSGRGQCRIKSVFAPGDKRRKICPLPSGAALRQIAVDEVACRFDAFCKPGYTMVCRVFDCWCARCRYLYR